MQTLLGEYNWWWLNPPENDKKMIYDYFFMFGKSLSAENVASIKMNIYVKKIIEDEIQKEQSFWTS